MARDIEKFKAANRRFQMMRYYRRRKMIDDIKLRNGCVDCGYKRHPQALHFDHVLGKTFHAFSQHAHIAWSKILGEIAKCEVRCANCHAVVTAKRRAQVSAGETKANRVTYQIANPIIPQSLPRSIW